MAKIFTLTLAMAMCLATVAMLGASRNGSGRTRSADVQMATDGAFRDGLYIGRLSAEAGRANVPQIGRWSNAADRASFVAGYRRGYGDVIAQSQAPQ